MSILTRAATTALTVTAAAVTLTAAAPAQAATSTHTERGQWAAGYLARVITANGGHVDNPSAYGGGVDYSSTTNAVLGLVANGVGSGAVTKATDYLAAHVDTFAKDSKGADKPGALALLVLDAHAAGRDPHSFGGTDLVSRLQATEGTYTPSGSSTAVAGFFGSQDPTYDGTYRQSLAVLALRAVGVTPDAAALDWLSGQQCPNGGWQPYRSDTTAACTSEDSNSTSAAVQALAKAGRTPSTDPTTYFSSLQGTDGGFSYTKPTDGTDANSTALGIQALLALGTDPAAFTRAGKSPYDALAALQLGCGAAGSSRGALDYQAENPLAANDYATVQAAQALAGSQLLVAPRTLSTAQPTVPCTSTTPSASPSSSGSTAHATASPVGGAGASTGSSSVAPEAATLPNTGSSAPVGRLALLGAALVATGTLCVSAGRRRRRGRHAA